LGLRATAAGTKAFLVQWTDKATGRKVREPLGIWGALTVENAREAARIRLGRIAAGFDPKVEREARRAEDERQRVAKVAAKEAATFTLDKLLTEWAALHLSTRRPRYAAEAIRALRLAFKGRLEEPAASLTHTAVIAVLDALSTEGKAATARLTLAYGRACYGWALKRRKLAANPFAGLPAVAGGAVARDRVLTSAEVGEVWRAAGKVAAPHGPMVRLALLTLARRDEVAGMRWGEVTADLSAWIQPGARTKNSKPHIVHLSAPARALLRERLGAEKGKPLPALPPPDTLVFGVGERPITAHSWAKRTMQAAIDAERAEAAKKTGAEPAAMPAWVLHDFRRSGVTWLAENGFPPHVADKLLNHVSGAISGVAAVYQRGEFLEERKRALDAWGAHVLAQGDGAASTANVARLADRRSKRKTA
jgi:integrase